MARYHIVMTLMDNGGPAKTVANTSVSFDVPLSGPKDDFWWETAKTVGRLVKAAKLYEETGECKQTPL